MNDWWECPACTLPNDPRYSLCVNCGGAMAAASAALRYHHRHDADAGTMFSPSTASASWTGRAASNASPRRSNASIEYDDASVVTPRSWQRNVDRGLDERSTVSRSAQHPTSSLHRLQVSASPRRRNTGQPFEHLLQDALPTAASNDYNGVGGRAVSNRSIASSMRLPPHPSSSSHLLTHPSPTKGRPQRRSSSPAHDDTDGEWPLQSNRVAGPSPRRSDDGTPSNRGRQDDRQLPPQEMVVIDAAIGALQGSYLTHRNNDMGREASQSHGLVVGYSGGRITQFERQADVIEQLKAQLADALEEVQSTRAACQRTVHGKDMELHTLRRELQQWKDEVMSVQKQHHTVNEELRRSSVASAELSHLVQRLRTEANLRVPNMVAEEFRHRMVTSLDARGEALQCLTHALGLLHASLGDRGLASKYAAQSIEAAALAHSNGIAALRSRVVQLEQELAVYRSSGDATRDGDDSGARTDAAQTIVLS